MRGGEPRDKLPREPNAPEGWWWWREGWKKIQPQCEKAVMPLTSEARLRGAGNHLAITLWVLKAQRRHSSNELIETSRKETLRVHANHRSPTARAL